MEPVLVFIMLLKTRLVISFNYIVPMNSYNRIC